MIVLGCNNISLSYGINTILNNINFTVHENDKVGIVGVNGAGKSTLFKIISGILQPDSGDVFIAKGCAIGYLEQNSGLDSSKSIWEELLSIYSHLIAMESRLKALEEKISKEKNQDVLSSLMKEYANLSDTYARNGGYEYNSKVRGVLRGLGFTTEQFDTKIEILSGGQKTRLALAKLLLEEPDILLLDEPTNHLDIESIEWLEDFLKSYKKCVLLISHDRYFLDVVTTKTLEIENRQSTMYARNYSGFLEQKALDREIQQKHYELQQREIAKMEAFIEQQKRWNREKNIIAAESRQKAIDRMEKIDKPKDLPDKIKIKFRSSIISGTDVLFVEHLSKEYPGKVLFKNISFQIKRGENVFLLGPNGCGKSTLLKILMGKIDSSSGAVEYGHKVEVGYYDQEQEDLDESNIIIDEVWNSNDKLTQTQIRDALASFLFKGEDVFKPVSTLSGGEKSRVALVKLMLSGANLLILDEPTNHLDINSREVLEEALMKFEGTILAVSHDRYFINKLSSRIIELDNSNLIDCAGNYSFYLDYKNKLKKVSDNKNNNMVISQGKKEHMASKEERARQRRVEKQYQETENNIHLTEERLKTIEAEMLIDEVTSDHVKLSELLCEQTTLKQKLEELYELWEALALERETMAGG